MPIAARLVPRRPTLLVALLAACATPAPRSSDSAGARTGRIDDTTNIARLERDARALVRTTGCDAASSCRTAPVGWRGCGGPRTYLVYCSASTDTVALMRTLEELKRAETAYNERESVVSTCEMRLPPNVTAEGGRCVEAR
jgi:hypothetical protein